MFNVKHSSFGCILIILIITLTLIIAKWKLRSTLIVDCSVYSNFKEVLTTHCPPKPTVSIFAIRAWGTMGSLLLTGQIYASTVIGIAVLVAFVAVGSLFLTDAIEESTERDRFYRWVYMYFGHASTMAFRPECVRV